MFPLHTHLVVRGKGLANSMWDPTFLIDTRMHLLTSNVPQVQDRNSKLIKEGNTPLLLRFELMSPWTKQ